MGGAACNGEGGSTNREQYRDGRLNLMVVVQVQDATTEVPRLGGATGNRESVTNGSERLACLVIFASIPCCAVS